MAVKYKLKEKLVFNTRALIALEEMSDKPLHLVMEEMQRTNSFKSTIMLFAAASGKDMDEAIDFIDGEIEHGLDLTILNEELTKAFEKSVFFKSPAVAELVKKPKATAKKNKSTKA